ncbi:MAG: hypothetical protein DRJ65_18950, partial [Acidobacteria bacterium]
MDKKIIYRIVLIVVVVGLAAWSVYPPSERINYGLDLSGGVHLVLQVQTDDAIKAELDDAGLRLVSVAEEQGITLGTAISDPENLSLTVEVPAGADRAVLSEIVLDYFGDYDVQRGADSWTLKFKANT